MDFLINLAAICAVIILIWGITRIHKKHFDDRYRRN